MPSVLWAAMSVVALGVLLVIELRVAELPWQIWLVAVLLLCFARFQTGDYWKVTGTESEREVKGILYSMSAIYVTLGLSVLWILLGWGLR